jgi:hypothetical protein
VNRVQRIQERLTPLKAGLLSHPIYQEIDRLDSLRLFMEHHAFAVWDFMSLLKALQRRLCCVEVPWLPTLDPLGSRLVNEIVLAEESDDDGRGGFASHFDLYHRAMTRCGANSAPIDGFLGELRNGQSVAAALESVGVAECVRRFVRQTFHVIEGSNLCAIASAFTFGREDLLPAVFQRIVDELNVEAGGGLETSSITWSGTSGWTGRSMARWPTGSSCPSAAPTSPTGESQSRRRRTASKHGGGCGTESAT